LAIQVKEGIVIGNSKLEKGVYFLQIAGNYNASPGQFYMLRSWDKEPLLSRPFSVFDLDKEKISFVYAIRGQGTRRLSHLHPGEEVTLTGPLGNGWKTPSGRVALVGGGVGIAALYLAAKTYKNVEVYLGFADKPYLVDAFASVAKAHVASETGNGGHKGLVLDVFNPDGYTACYACGPEPMLAAMHDLCQKRSLPLYVSLEARMACGVGACLGCMIETTHGFSRVCRDGPVFEANEVVFHA
jgi:dihydroorotate dehydrogenase electron transfer subunit